MASPHVTLFHPNEEERVADIHNTVQCVPFYGVLPQCGSRLLKMFGLFFEHGKAGIRGGFAT